MKKIILLLLSVVLACTAFTGCVSKKTYTPDEIKTLLKKGQEIKTLYYKLIYSEGDVEKQKESFWAEGVNFKREVSDETGKTTIIIGDDKTQTGFDSVTREGAKYPVDGAVTHMAAAPSEQIDATTFAFVGLEKLLNRNVIKATIEGSGEGRTISLWADVKTGLILKQQLESADMNAKLEITEISFKPIPSDTFTIPTDLNITEDMTQIPTGEGESTPPEEELIPDGGEATAAPSPAQ